MFSIRRKFEQLKKENKRAFIPFIMAGDPDLQTTKKLILALQKGGADLIELGIPFSDPIADGPTIQASGQRALKNQVSLKNILKLVKEIRKEITAPLILMTYLNPIFNFGMKNFAQSASSSGIDGVIISDMPPDEGGEWVSLANKNHLDTIFLLAPTSTPERIKLASKYSTGFVYCVSVTGVTGARKTLPPDLKNLVRKIKSCTEKPVAVGFGVSTPGQVRMACQWADGAVVGSALVSLIQRNLGKSDFVEKVENFTRSLKSALEDK